MALVHPIILKQKQPLADGADARWLKFPFICIAFFRDSFCNCFLQAITKTVKSMVKRRQSPAFGEYAMRLIRELRNDGRFGTSRTYSKTRSSFLLFQSGEQAVRHPRVGAGYGSGRALQPLSVGQRRRAQHGVVLQQGLSCHAMLAFI